MGRLIGDIKNAFRAALKEAGGEELSYIFVVQSH
jgi:hypothetical protein